MCLFCFRRTCTLTPERRQHRKTAGQAVSSDSSGAQEDLQLNRTYGTFSFSIIETENGSALDGLRENANYMQSDTQVYLWFSTFPLSIAEFLDTRGWLSGKGI